MASSFGGAYLAAKADADAKAIASGKAAQAAIRNSARAAKAAQTRKARKNTREIREAFAA